MQAPADTVLHIVAFEGFERDYSLEYAAINKEATE